MKAHDVTLEQAREEDAATLCEIAVRAFHTDVDYGGRPESGPPGYDSPERQAEFMKHCDYYKILLDGRIVGALLVVPRGAHDCECVGIWVEPQHHRQGIGRRAFELAFSAYPDATRWTVETPQWNRRTAAFYGSLGFTRTGQHGEDAVYELRLPRSA